MITVAVPEGETTPDMFVLDMRKVPWGGSPGVTLTAAWGGHGMAATQSHAMAFKEFPVTRLAWPGQLGLIQEATGALTQCVFTAVIVGVVEVRPRNGAPAGDATPGRSAGVRAGAVVESRARRLADPAGL
jgi:hypothetical protein